MKNNIIFVFILSLAACKSAVKEYEATMQKNASDTNLSMQKSEGAVVKNIDTMSSVPGSVINDKLIKKLDTVTFGMGCFWCTEALFSQLKGVIDVEVGFSGGSLKNVTYNEVEKGETGHAEVLQIIFDSTIIKLPDLLELFWKSHDPTTLNRQGNDIGTQYRSVIFYHNTNQKQRAETYLDVLEKEMIWSEPIVTEISAFRFFVKADETQQNYFQKNPEKAYCRLVIQPKYEKFKKIFHDKLK